MTDSVASHVTLERLMHPPQCRCTTKTVGVTNVETSSASEFNPLFSSIVQCIYCLPIYFNIQLHNVLNLVSIYLVASIIFIMEQKKWCPWYDKHYSLL